MTGVKINKGLRSKLLFKVVPIAFVCTGCSTIQTHSGEGNQFRPYIGTSVAIDKAKKVWKNYDYYGQFEFYAADVPASFIADTIIFPYDLYKYLKNDTENEKNGFTENKP